MKTFLGFEVSYAPCKCKINSDIRVHLVVLVKWCPLADSVIVAPLADVFSSIYQIAPYFEIVVFKRAFYRSRGFFKRDGLHCQVSVVR